MPTWGWYVIGAGLFVVAYLYLQARNANTTQQVSLTSTGDNQTYNNIVQLETQILNQQQSELGGASGAPPIQIHPAV